ncbi:energy-coupling factor transporter transmembrane component T [Ahrensia marina]|uniref:energy-coupling factor transporter transmembrane component T family protein n=1 Tax=Ahrensia marina TaxID=1514904 RepID=UPI0035D080DE
MISLTSPVETRAHGWPAGAKLLLLCAATIILVANQSLAFQIAAFLACLALYALPGRTFFTAGIKALWALWPFLVLLVVWHLVIGDPSGGALIALRLLTAVGLATLVTMTTRLSDMIAVVQWLLKPFARFGLNTRALELGIALVIRFTPTLADKGRQLGAAWQARARSKPRWRVILPFTVLAIDDAEQVAEAIRARGGLNPTPRR